MTNDREHPCLKRLDADCFAARPEWAKQAFAYRLVHLLTPKALTKRLPKGLRRALIAPGVVVPPGVDLPPGVVVGPGAVLPPTWTPPDLTPPGVTITPGTDFPPGWTPGDPLPEGVTLDPGATFPPGWSPGDPLPPGAIEPGTTPPGVDETGASPPTYTEPWSPGPVHVPSGGAPAVEHGSGTYYPAIQHDNAFWGEVYGIDYNKTYLAIGFVSPYYHHMLTIFNNVLAPQGATIKSAIVSLQSKQSRSGVPVDLKCYANDVDTPGHPIDNDAAEALTLTTAYVDWTLTAWTLDIRYDMPNIKEIIQEIVNRPNWEPGNNIMIVIRTQTTSTNYRYLYACHLGLPDKVASLYVEW